MLARGQAIKEMHAGTRLVHRPDMRRERVGRLVGAIGGACASLMWGLLLLGCLAWLLDPPRGLAGIAIIGILPISVIAVLLFVASVASVVVLYRRADTQMPWRVGTVHLLLALVIAYSWKGWIVALVFITIAASQLVAIHLMRQRRQA